jgi:prophage regulatory protein
VRAKEKAVERGEIPELPTTGLLKVEDVLRVVPVARATWYRGVASGTFPQPMRLGNLTFWHTRDIRYLIDHRFKAKRVRSAPRES